MNQFHKRILRDSCHYLLHSKQNLNHLQNQLVRSYSLVVNSKSNLFQQKNYNHLVYKMSSSNDSTAEVNGSTTTSRAFKIYTRTGDTGTSALYSGERRPKTDMVFEALGSTDELSSFLGLAREFLEESQNKDLSLKLSKIQCLLQDIGSNIATPRSSTQSEFKLKKTEFDIDGRLVKELEDWIDEFDGQLPKLTNFILPSGGKAASTLHVCRSVCRRAERRVHPVVDEGIADISVGKYLNRLSDFLFVAARYASQVEGKKEEIYRKAL